MLINNYKNNLSYLSSIIEKNISVGGNKNELFMWNSIFDYLDAETQQVIISNIKDQYNLLKNNNE